MRYSTKYRQLQMELARVQAELKHVNFLSKQWQELDKKETEILNMMAQEK